MDAAVTSTVAKILNKSQTWAHPSKTKRLRSNIVKNGECALEID